jgi:molybdate transport system substrate-binding protein
VRPPSGIAALAAALVLAACAPSASPSPSPPAPSSAPASAPASVEPFELTVFGAASLTDALAEIESVYEAERPGANLVIATDSSAALRTQIEEGAPADVFLSADSAHPAALAEAGLASSDPVRYAGNSLALVVPGGNPAGIESPVDLATPGVLVIAAGPEVPITAYTAEVVANLAALPGYPANFAEAYAANVASEEENVRAVLNRIELNEGDAGFVYETDALASDAVTVVDIPEEANTAATYAGCVIAASEHLAEAEAFLAWLTGPDGQSILAEFGFVAP